MLKNLRAAAGHRRIGNLGVFVAVGVQAVGDAYILKSANTESWTEQSNPQNISLRGVASNGSIFCAVGNGDGSDAYIITSPDGETWTNRPNISGNPFYLAVCYGNSLFVAVGINGDIATSPDAITWTARTTPETVTLRSVTWNGTNFVAVGDDIATDTVYVVTSPTGVTWTKRTTPSAAPYDLYAVASSGSGILVAVSPLGGPYALRSTDNGVTWSSVDVSAGGSSPLWSIMWDGSQFIASGSKQLRSSDGITWTFDRYPPEAVYEIIYNSSIYIAIGSAGRIDTAISPTGTWTEQINGGYGLSGIAAL